ncbi:cytochrome P450 [Nocardia sp. alder85J]|uniref:cytochrome P450 n=1 Tax=Nocardia sp. alder85J TaxID=2862949 RepID=UPI001CD2B9BB|nr:cytochrome P450 [Nocardia sp. alder85J]MCX4095618.1 cytochrome P450 [Nocardia sp. alder85J]
MSKTPACPIDHHSYDYARNARDLHDKFRKECPVGWSEEHGGFWVMSRYADIRAALRDPKTFSSGKTQDANGVWNGGAAIPSGQNTPFMPLEADPPEALAYRTLITKWLSPGPAAAMRPALAAYVDECLDRVEASNRMDVITDIGSLPAYAVTLVLGIDRDLAHRIAWPFNSLDALERGTPEFEKATQEMGWVVGFLHEICAQRRENPGDDNISSLVTSEINGQLLPIDQCVWTLMTVIGGGVATTTAAMSHCLDRIDRNPEIRRRLIEDHALIPQAVEEMLRLNPPVWQVTRTVRTETEVDGVTLETGDRVLLSVLSANYDPAEFPNPREIDIDRPNNKHMSFGFGVHRCAGLEVARAELELMLSRLLARFPNFTVLRDECRPFVEAAHNDGYSRFPISLGVTA